VESKALRQAVPQRVKGAHVKISPVPRLSPGSYRLLRARETLYARRAACIFLREENGEEKCRASTIKKLVCRALEAIALHNCNFELWCGRRESNPHSLAASGFSYLYGFRRPDAALEGRVGGSANFGKRGSSPPHL